MRMENSVETAMRKEIGQLRQKYLEVFGEESRSSHRQFLFSEDRLAHPGNRRRRRFRSSEIVGRRIATLA